VGSVVWLAANSGGLKKSTNSGASFSAVSGGGLPAGQTVTLVATNPHDVSAATQHVIASVASVAACDAGTGVCPIYVSADGGANWTAANIAGAQPFAGTLQRLTAVAYGPGATVYALYGDPNLIGTYLLSSTDNGATWSTPAPAKYGSAVAASPATAATLWLDAAKSVNSGVSFTPLGTVGRKTNGTFVPGTSSIAVSPNYPATPRLWIGTPFAGTYLSNDDGATWARAATASPRPIRTVIIRTTTRAFAGSAIRSAIRAAFCRST
jgi:hypothetical protein